MKSLCKFFEELGHVGVASVDQMLRADAFQVDVEAWGFTATGGPTEILYITKERAMQVYDSMRMRSVIWPNEQPEVRRWRRREWSEGRYEP